MNVSQREDGNYVHSLPPRIRQNYPYGLSGIGLLVDNGQGQPQSESNIQNNPFQSRDSRTAITWTTDRMHFFIIVARSYDGSSLREGWTWSDTVNFFTTKLPNWMINDLPNGSSQIAWRWRRSNGIEARRQHLEHRRTREGQWIPRRVPTFMEVPLMHLKWKVVNLAIFAFVASAFTPSLHGGNHQEEPLLLWTELRSPIGSAYGACLELSPDRRLMWYSKITDSGMTIRKVRDDLTLSEIILDTNERRKERK